jgi:hypothetical protein
MQFRFVGCIRKEKSLPANKLKGEKEYGQDYFIRTLDFNSIYILGDKQNMLVTIGPEHVKMVIITCRKIKISFVAPALCFFLLDSILRVAFKIHTIGPPEHKAQTSIFKHTGQDNLYGSTSETVHISLLAKTKFLEYT